MLYVVDTHALFWHLTDHKRLSAAARQVFEAGLSGAAMLVLSPIVLLELYALLHKVNAPVDFASEIRRLQAAPYFRIEAVTVDDLLLLDRLPDIPEMHDRIIAALGVRLGATVVTLDPAIRGSRAVQSLW